MVSMSIDPEAAATVCHCGLRSSRRGLRRRRWPCRPANEEVTEAYITKNSRESLMRPEHEKFLDPLQL
jgi:hypothetical protein